MDDPIKAAEIANASGDKAACYHLARQYENIDNIPEAIHFFSKAQAYSNAIRICKEQGKNKPIIGLVLTTKLIWYSTPISTFDSLSKWHDSGKS